MDIIDHIFSSHALTQCSMCTLESHVALSPLNTQPFFISIVAFQELMDVKKRHASNTDVGYPTSRSVFLFYLF